MQDATGKMIGRNISVIYSPDGWDVSKYGWTFICILYMTNDMANWLEKVDKKANLNVHNFHHYTGKPSD